MENRRAWLKKVGLVTIAGSVLPITTLATSPTFPRSIQDDPIRLDLNENPYGPSPIARQKMSEHIVMNRYDRHLVNELVVSIAKKNDVSKDHVFLTAGSTEALDATVRYAALNKGSFITASPTFNYFSNIAEILGMTKISLSLSRNKTHNLPNMLNAVRSDTRLVYLCNPNNPTGTICQRQELVSFIEEVSKQALILVDEAYLDFTDEKSLKDIAITNKNVIVTKTFSKIYGLAGARVGYAIGHPDTLKKIGQLMTWSTGDLSTVSAVGALASLQDQAFIEEVRTLNKTARDYTVESLETLGIPCIPSLTNFVYISLEGYEANYYTRLNSNKIRGGRIYEDNGKWARISIGTLEEMQYYIKALS